MSVVSLLHQKGGTGKSTLAIAAAVALVRAGHGALLIDADPQGTAAEWANRFGRSFGVEALPHPQPTFPELVAGLGAEWPWIIIDGPPSLSTVTESILAATDRVIIPVRPSRPDVWALPWFAAIVRKLRREGHALEPLVVFNLYRAEPLAPLLEELAEWEMPVWEETIPADPAFALLFEGHPLPSPLRAQLLRLLRV